MIIRRYDWQHELHHIWVDIDSGVNALKFEGGLEYTSSESGIRRITPWCTSDHNWWIMP